MKKLLAVSAICAGSVLAQSRPPGTAVPEGAPPLPTVSVRGFRTVSDNTVFAGPMQTVTGAPYSAQAVTERVQPLADGNRIVEKTSGSVARDSQGRTRRDEGLPDFILSKGEAPHLILIEDPVAGLHWNLDPRTKTAFKISVAPTKAGQGGPPPSFTFAQSMPPEIGANRVFFYSSGVMPRANIQIIGKGQQADDTQVSKTDLGTQMMEGVSAQGTRVTRTIPAGEVGNEQPLVITSETWYSPRLKVLVLSKTSDPRMGETTYRLTDIQQAEPPADLFEVPADYRIKNGPDVRPDVMELRTTKRVQ